MQNPTNPESFSARQTNVPTGNIPSPGRYSIARKDGIDKDSAKQILKEIHAVVSAKFLYRRWSASRHEYLSYPGKGEKYSITRSKG